MKDILVTGCTSLLKKNMFDHLREDIRVILADDASAYAEGTKGRVYRYGPEDRSFAQLFDVYSFHTVIYVSGYADGGTGMVNEVLKLEQMLLQSSRAHVDKVIVLSSIESMNYVPVIGNGDIETPQDAKRMYEETGCDAFMIGRAAKGNPWIFRQMNHYMETGELLPKPDFKEVINMILRHGEMMMDFKGEYTGMREMRKHVAWYTCGYPNSSRLRGKINEVETMKDFRTLLEEYERSCRQ